VTPAVVLAPLVGFVRPATGPATAALFRPDVGGTVAAARCVGIGFEVQLLETIYPQSFDVPMDLIVTEASARRRYRYDPSYRHRRLFRRRTALCYRTICAEGARFSAPVPSLDAHPRSRVRGSPERDDWEGVGGVSPRHASSGAIGADFCLPR
jgi:hypothetical protein